MASYEIDLNTNRITGVFKAISPIKKRKFYRWIKKIDRQIFDKILYKVYTLSIPDEREYEYDPKR